MSIRGKFLLIAVLILFSGCFFNEKEPKWDGYVHPDKRNLRVQKNIGTFKTLEECISASRKFLKDNNLTDDGTIMCGKNCVFNQSLNLDVCEARESN